MALGALRRHEQRLGAAAGAAHSLGHGVRHAHEVRLGEPVHVPVVGGVALDHAQAHARLAPALGRLHASLVEREPEALAILGVQLAQVAAVDERPRDHALGEVGCHQGHGSYPSTTRTMLSETSSAVS